MYTLSASSKKCWNCTTYWCFTDRWILISLISFYFARLFVRDAFRITLAALTAPVSWLVNS